MPASGARARCLALFLGLVRAWADLAVPAGEEAPPPPRPGAGRACPPQPCRTAVLPVLWGSPRPPRQPGTSVPAGSRGPGTRPQLLNGTEASLGTRNVACPVSQDRPWPGLARWPRTVSWGWEWCPRLPQGDLAGQGQSPTWGGRRVPSVPGVQAAWSLGAGVLGAMDSGWSAVGTPP